MYGNRSLNKVQNLAIFLSFCKAWHDKIVASWNLNLLLSFRTANETLAFGVWNSVRRYMWLHIVLLNQESETWRPIHFRSVYKSKYFMTSLGPQLHAEAVQVALGVPVGALRFISSLFIVHCFCFLQMNYPVPSLRINLVVPPLLHTPLRCSAWLGTTIDWPSSSV